MNRCARTPFGMTVGCSPHPSATSAATAADTQMRAYGSTTALSWHSASTGVVNSSRWWMVRMHGPTALALMQSCACTMS